MNSGSSHFKYNYLIIGSGGYYHVGYYDVLNLNNVRYFYGFQEGLSLITKALARITFSRKVNKIFHYPFSRFTFKNIFRGDFSDRKPLCVLIFSSYIYLVYSGYVDYLKRSFPGCKLIFYYQDRVSVHTPGVDMNLLKNKFDLVLSYDQEDCAEYDLIYYPTPYSYYIIPDNSSNAKSDVFYCGKAKTRYSIIHNLYLELTSKGIKCDFYLADVPYDCPRIEGIKYNMKLTYSEYLQHLSCSKCVLEVQQENTLGFTPRLWESIMFDKHLLTNNTSVFTSKYYNPCFMHPIESVGDGGFKELINTPVYYTMEDKDLLSPIRLLKHIEHILI